MFESENAKKEHSLFKLMKSQTIPRGALVRTLLEQHQYFPEVGSNLRTVNCDARGKQQF